MRIYWNCYFQLVKRLNPSLDSVRLDRKNLRQLTVAYRAVQAEQTRLADVQARASRDSLTCELRQTQLKHNRARGLLGFPTRPLLPRQMLTCNSSSLLLPEILSFGIKEQFKCFKFENLFFRWNFISKNYFSFVTSSNKPPWNVKFQQKIQLPWKVHSKTIDRINDWFKNVKKYFK